MTRRTVLRALSVQPVVLGKGGGLLLPPNTRTVAVLPGGDVGKLDVIYEQEIDLVEDTPKEEAKG